MRGQQQGKVCDGEGRIGNGGLEVEMESDDRRKRSWRSVSQHVARSSIDTAVVDNYSLFFLKFVFCFIPTLRCASYCKMRWYLSFLLFCFLAVVHALSSSGNRLVVILEEAAEKELYSSFWSDLQGKFSEVKGWY